MIRTFRQPEVEHGGKIKPYSQCKNPEKVQPGQVFVQHQQIVSKIKVGFEGTLARKRSTIDVVYLHLPIIVNLFPCQSQPPAKINLFHMSKKQLVKTAKSMKVISFNTETGAGSPIHFLAIIILMQVFFSMIKNPSPAVRIS